MNSFIYTNENVVPKHICDGVIEFFEQNKEHHVPGFTYTGHEEEQSKISTVNKDHKDSMDISIDMNLSYGDADVYLQLMISILSDCMEEYKEKYFFLNDIYVWTIEPVYNIQRYEPGQGYKAWHCENNGPGKGSERIMAWMIYLNDVPDGGTEFNYELPNLDAKTGTVAIWPAYWTHFHRGIVSHTKTKYIVTGWFSYVEESAGGGVKDET